ncbi:MAG: LTA synthase family protein [Victivallaceae bacterium]|nr:LTA synthase family protein [Victivallaceae bacterium]
MLKGTRFRKLCCVLAFFAVALKIGYSLFVEQYGFANTGNWDCRMMKYTGIGFRSAPVYFTSNSLDNFAIVEAGRTPRSTEELLVGISKVFAGGTDYDLRYLGAVCMTLYLAGIGLVLLWLGKSKINPLSFVLGLCCVLALSFESAAFSFFNTFYAQSALYVFFTLYVGCFLNNFSGSIRKRMLFSLGQACCIFLLAWASTDGIVLVPPLVLLSVSQCIPAPPGENARRKRLLAYVVLTCALCGFCWKTAVGRMMEDKAEFYHLVHCHLLPSMHDIPQFLKERGFSESEIQETGKMLHSNVYSTNDDIDSIRNRKLLRREFIADAILQEPWLIAKIPLSYSKNILRSVDGYARAPNAKTDRPIDLSVTMLPRGAYGIGLVSCLLLLAVFMFRESDDRRLAGLRGILAVPMCFVVILAAQMPWLHPYDEILECQFMNYVILCAAMIAICCICEAIPCYLPRNQAVVSCIRSPFAVHATKELLWGVLVAMAGVLLIDVISYFPSGYIVFFLNQGKDFLLAASFLFAVYLCFRFSTTIYAGTALFAAFAILWGVANKAKLGILGEPVARGDFISMGHLLSLRFVLVSTPALYWTFITIGLICCSLVVFLFVFYLRMRGWKRRCGKMLLSCAGLALPWLSSCAIGAVAKGNGTTGFSHRCILSFLSSDERTEVPDWSDISEYAKESSLLEQRRDGREEARKPLVVVILSESHMNVRNLDKIIFHSPPPFDLDSLARECEKSGDVFARSGNLYSHTFGGMTVFSELEFLTGVSHGYYNTYPHLYIDSVGRISNSIPRTLNRLGYETTYCAPFSGNMFSACTVMPKCHFGRTLFEEQFVPSYSPYSYTPDRDSFACLERLFGDEDVPKFFFLTTMQNHWPYLHDGGEPFPVSMPDTTAPEVQDIFRRYCSGLRESEIAFKEFLKHLRTEKRKILVVLFGDHAPCFRTGMGTGYAIDNIYPLSSEPDMSRFVYRTPYFVWANYEMPHPETLVAEMNIFELGWRVLYAGGVIPMQMPIPLFDHLHESENWNRNIFMAGYQQSLFRSRSFLEPEHQHALDMYRVYSFLSLLPEEARKR